MVSIKSLYEIIMSIKKLHYSVSPMDNVLRKVMLSWSAELSCLPTLAYLELICLVAQTPRLTSSFFLVPGH